MKAKELAEELLKHPDFDVEFISLGEIKDEEDVIDGFPYLFRFNNIEVGDIGHSDRVIVLTGKESE